MFVILKKKNTKNVTPDIACFFAAHIQGLLYGVEWNVLAVICV